MFNWNYREETTPSYHSEMSSLGKKMCNQIIITKMKMDSFKHVLSTTVMNVRDKVENKTQFLSTRNLRFRDRTKPTRDKRATLPCVWEAHRAGLGGLGSGWLGSASLGSGHWSRDLNEVRTRAT